MRRFIFIFVICMLGARRQDASSRPSSRSSSTPILDLAIRVATERGRRVDEPFVREQVARIVEDFKLNLKKIDGGDNEPKKTLAALASAIFNIGKFKHDERLDSPETFYIDSVIKNRAGYCLSLSILTLAVAEGAGLHLEGVAAPNHFFVRFADGKENINMETTRGGAAVADAEFLKQMGDSYHSDSIYLKSLSLAQIEAVLLHNRGFIALCAKDFDGARADFDRALSILPSLPEVHRNLGVLLGERKQFAPAIEELNRALLLYPADADALVNRAICKDALGDGGGAADDLEIALLVDPKKKNAVEMLERIRGDLMKDNFISYQKRVVKPLASPPRDLAPGLTAVFYKDTKLAAEVTKRIDAEIDFDWQNSSPARGVPADRFSIRWDGWLRAPDHSKYTIFIVANDGARLIVDDKILLEQWRDVGYENYYGTTDVNLIAGYHRIRVEYYDESGGARMMLKIGVEGREKPLRLSEHFYHEDNK